MGSAITDGFARQIEFRFTVEEVIDGQVTASHSTRCIVARKFDALQILAAARNAVEGSATAADAPPPHLCEGSSLKDARPSHTQRPEAARPPAVFSDPAWMALLRRLTDDGNLWEGFADLPAQHIIENREVQQAVKRLAEAGCADALRLVIKHGPARCIQVHAWSIEVQKRDAIKRPSALISSVLERGEPRGSVRRSA